MVRNKNLSELLTSYVNIVQWKKKAKKIKYSWFFANKMLSGWGVFQWGGKQFQTNNNFILALFIYILNEILSKLQLVSVAKFYSPRVRDGEMERFCVFINIKEKNHAFSLMIKLFFNIFFFYNMSVKKPICIHIALMWKFSNQIEIQIHSCTALYVLRNKVKLSCLK